VDEVGDVGRENDELRKRLAEMTAEASNKRTIMSAREARELTLLRATHCRSCCCHG